MGGGALFLLMGRPLSPCGDFFRLAPPPFTKIIRVHMKRDYCISIIDRYRKNVQLCLMKIFFHLSFIWFAHTDAVLKMFLTKCRIICEWDVRSSVLYVMLNA